MDTDQAAVFLLGSIGYGIGFLLWLGVIVIANNLISKFWKPVRVFTADSFHPFSQPLPRYATEEEIKAANK